MTDGENIIEQTSDPVAVDADQEVARLADLSPADYDRARRESHVLLGIRLTTLDGLVETKRRQNSRPMKKVARIVVLPENAIILDKSAPLETARVIVSKQHVENEMPTLYHQQSTFVSWTGTHYREYLNEELRSDIYHFLETAMVYGKEEEPPRPFKPSMRSVSDILDALRAACQLDNEVCAPTWLSNIPDMPPASEIISCRNGLLHLPTGDMFPHSPDFYAMNALDYDYNPDAEFPQHWIEFLNSVWGKDQEAVETLQEIFGYLLGTDTDQQKIPLIVGPKRSGKGTIARTLTSLVGTHSVVSPTLGSLEGPFGMQPLLGKSIALIADARLGGRADQQRIAERLLSISGEDIQTVERKNISAWTGKLPTRFIIMSNELPRISDPSGALGSRFLVLTMTNSFYGHEDHSLMHRILDEMPGILNWAIAGWRALKNRKNFLMPKSSLEAVQQIEDLGSPITAFLREECILDPNSTITPSSLYHAWSKWCTEQGREHKGTMHTFGKDLLAVIPTVGPRQLGGREDRERYYVGVELKKVFDSNNKSGSETEPGLDY